MKTYINICKIDSQWEFAVWLRKLKQGLCINLARWEGVGDGWGFQKGGVICIPMADSCWGLTENKKFCKAIILQLKNKYIFLKKKCHLKLYTKMWSGASHVSLSTSIQFSHSVMSNSLQPHTLQHTRLLCPLLSPRFCSNLCPLSQRCYLII